MATTTSQLTAALLTQLEREHRTVEGIFKKLEKAHEESTQRPLVDQLSVALGQHMEKEESIVYPALEAIDGEMGEEARIEHSLARDGLNTLQGMIGMPGFGAAVAMLQAGIEHHVEEEEEEAFPKLRKRHGLAPRKAANKSAAKKSAAKKPATKKPAAKK